MKKIIATLLLSLCCCLSILAQNSVKGVVVDGATVAGGVLHALTVEGGIVGRVSSVGAVSLGFVLGKVKKVIPQCLPIEKDRCKSYFRVTFLI